MELRTKANLVPFQRKWSAASLPASNTQAGAASGWLVGGLTERRIAGGRGVLGREIQRFPLAGFSLRDARDEQ